MDEEEGEEEVGEFESAMVYQMQIGAIKVDQCEVPMFPDLEKDEYETSKIWVKYSSKEV